MVIELEIRGGETMSVTCTESVLRTQQAKEAMLYGFFTFLSTGNLQTGWDVMIAKGKENGSYLAVKIAFVIDFVKALRGY